MGRDDVREARDYSNAVPRIGGVKERGAIGRGRRGKSRGSLRM
jgi:hypothetical protein